MIMPQLMQMVSVSQPDYLSNHSNYLKGQPPGPPLLSSAGPPYYPFVQASNTGMNNQYMAVNNGQQNNSNTFKVFNTKPSDFGHFYEQHFPTPSTNSNQIQSGNLGPPSANMFQTPFSDNFGGSIQYPQYFQQLPSESRIPTVKSQESLKTNNKNTYINKINHLKRVDSKKSIKTNQSQEDLVAFQRAGENNSSGPKKDFLVDKKTGIKAVKSDVFPSHANNGNGYFFPPHNKVSNSIS